MKVCSSKCRYTTWRTSESQDARLIPPNLWPPNSPDLNPVDYKIWGLLQEWVYKTSVKDVDELPRRIAEEWGKLDQRIIDKAVAECRKRLWACVAAGGGQFEHKMWTFIISDILYRNFVTPLFEMLLLCSVKTVCFVEYNACYVLHFVTAIILRYTKNICKICNCKPHPPKASLLPNTCM